MINIGAAARDGQVVQDRPPVSLQRVEEPGGAPLPHRPSLPGAGSEPQPQPAVTAASPATTSSSRGYQYAAKDFPTGTVPRMTAIRQGRVRVSGGLT